MDSNLNPSISLFPNPPSHYKNFTRENSMMPPDINNIEKFESFMSFGVEYKLGQVNTITNPIDTAFLNCFDPKIIDKKKIPNQSIFQNPDINIANLTVDNLKTNIFQAIKKEINFLKKTYLNFLNQITINEDFELDSCLIKFSFQKIYFFISLLKKKKVNFY